MAAGVYKALTNKFVVAGSALGTVGLASYYLIFQRNKSGFTVTENLSKKTFVITGATSGIGKETALVLAKKKARVILASRDMEKCRRARQELRLGTSNKKIYCMHCDLASLRSVADFATKLLQDGKRIDCLINNAAVMASRPDRFVTEDGFELHLGVNYLGHYLLTMLLLESMAKNTTDTTIVNVAGIAIENDRIDFDDLNNDKSYNWSKAFRQSKLAPVIFTKELADRLKGTNVRANAVNPGLSRSELDRHAPYRRRRYVKRLIDVTQAFTHRKPAKSAGALLHAALAPDANGVYFDDMVEETKKTEAEDPTVRQRLWLTSEKWTRLAQFRTEVQAKCKLSAEQRAAPPAPQATPVKTANQEVVLESDGDTLLGSPKSSQDTSGSGTSLNPLTWIAGKVW